ncbi:hypothetical protein Rhopal_004001-T1 [Rhodotorula paludigena]|uniref:LysM domain-containing protein n=1 Tax=Rhodotorula paludigena TaxID=86838 RepID=A0AAV5GNP4_9BASI|nr:hypothetical protein Rhopal_004001-T1 [Rhodotorula paludigena]
MPVRAASTPTHSRTSTPVPLPLPAGPLRLPESPRDASSGAAFGEPFAPPEQSAQGLSAGLRSRRSISPLPPRTPSPRGDDRANYALNGPTASTSAAVSPRGSPAGSPGGAVPAGEVDGYVLRRDSKGKGKAKEGDRGSSENGASAGKEREVIVHQVKKTDTFASVSLQYGITPQNLRASNRLWPSDPIFLRSTLLIPLDQCNLPSSSFGVERIAREENGDLTVWERSRGAARPTAGGGLGSAAEREQREDGLVSPRARHIAAASAFELSAGTLPSVESEELVSTADNEYHSVWSDGTPSVRGSLDIARPPISPEITSYFATTNNAYAGPSGSSTPPEPPTVAELVSGTVSPSTATASASVSSSFSPVPSSSSPATSPPLHHPRLSRSPDSAAAGTPAVSKRTLHIQRMPASQLAFFPPSSSDPASPSKEHPPTSRSRVPRRAGPAATGGQSGGPAEGDSLFFGPLTNSLASSFSSLGLNRYLPSSLSPSTSSGSIALPPSPAETRSPNGSALSLGVRVGRKLSSRWAVLDFGAEEDDAAAALAGQGGAGASRGDYFSLSQRFSGGGLGTGLGLREFAGWDSSPAPPPPPPRHRKARDSNAGLPPGSHLGAPGGGRARADVRDTFALR